MIDRCCCFRLLSLTLVTQPSLIVDPRCFRLLALTQPSINRGNRCFRCPSLLRCVSLPDREQQSRAAELDHTTSFIVSMHRLYRPPSKLPMSDWADQYRVLSSESSAEPGQWITAKAPYEREIMNAISDPMVA